MQPVQLGDVVQVHYVKRLQGGSVVTSRERAPIQVTVGTHHPRLPGLGSALLGMLPGASVTVNVPTERAYGPYDSRRVRRWSRTRFAGDGPLPVGKWVLVSSRGGRRRAVRILEVTDGNVLVDTNHRFAGQSLEMEVEVLSVQPRDTGLQESGLEEGAAGAKASDHATTRQPRDWSPPQDPLREVGGEA